jgi:hypothetical protein
MSSIVDHRPQHYPRTVGGVVLLSGLLLFITWTIRAYILFLTAAGGASRAGHTVITLGSLAAAVLLLRIGYRTIRRQGRPTDGRWLMAIGIWMLGIGGHRLIMVLTEPARDPNPRAHLHLSVLFLVIGAVLLVSAWQWTRGVKQ